MARPTAVALTMPERRPGLVQLEDDNKAPLLQPEQLAARALSAQGLAETMAAHYELVSGHLATVAACLVDMISDLRPELVIDGMVVIDKARSDRMTGAQVEAVQVGDDIGVIVRERAPELFIGVDLSDSRVVTG